jgi:hypothetical protein
MARSTGTPLSCVKNGVFFALLGLMPKHMQYILDIMNYMYYFTSIMYCIEVATCQSAK